MAQWPPLWRVLPGLSEGTQHLFNGQISLLAWPGPSAWAQLQPHPPVTTLPAEGDILVAGLGPAQALELLGHK